MQSHDVIGSNTQKIAQLFPNCVTERLGKDGKPELAIDFEKLQAELSNEIIAEGEERYQFTWPDKRAAVRLANTPTTMTLRPCREESVDFDNTQNLYIEGDNLDVLKVLRETYLGKVKMIYIDPPYNTGNDFVYNDDFAQGKDDFEQSSGLFDEEGNQTIDPMQRNTESNGRFHTDWLNMIYPRLKVARDLLTDDGVIFMSIDDNEVDNLRKCCDEIFGNQNFIAHIIHKNNSMKNQSKYVGVSTEFILIYSKDFSFLNLHQPSWRCKKKGAGEINSIFLKLKNQNLSLEEIREEILELYSRPKYSHLSRWNKVDELGVFMDSDLSRSNGPKDYTIINPTTGTKCLIPNRGWGKSKEELERLQRENLIWYGDNSTPPRMKSYLSEDSESVFDNFIFADTSIDKKNIDTMFGRQVFDYPKPLEVLKQLTLLCTYKNSLILDFFSGSATTAHAVMKLNAEDGGNRKFIMVQLPEKTDEKSEAYKAGYKNICEIGKERIRRAGRKINEELGVRNEKLDTGFRVLKLDSSNMEDVYYTPQDFDLQTFFSENVKADRSSEDLLFQVMLDLGIELSAKIESKQIAGKEVHFVDDTYLVACFDTDVNETTIKEIAKLQPIYFVMRDASASNDNVIDNFEQIFRHYSPDTNCRII